MSEKEMAALFDHWMNSWRNSLQDKMPGHSASDVQSIAYQEMWEAFRDLVGPHLKESLS